MLQIPRIRKPNPRIYGSDDETSSGSTQKQLRKQSKTTTAVRILLYAPLEVDRETDSD